MSNRQGAKAHGMAPAGGGGSGGPGPGGGAGPGGPMWLLHQCLGSLARQPAASSDALNGRLQAAQAFDAETLRLARANPGFVAELEAAFDLFLESPATRRA